MSTSRILSNRAFRASAVLGLAVTTALTTASATQAAPTSKSSESKVPENLIPPAGNSEVARFKAAGVQIYQCTGDTWTFVEPAATLTGRAKATNKRNEAIHFRGPSWQSVTDGSLVEAKSTASSPGKNAIPLLLLQTTKTRGDGIFGDVTYIQRLKTKGGLAPTGSCTEGATQSVPYKAHYVFFAAP
ncbi:DUF3455 domain-containing protein [Kineosporia rhizophila]|uniref:DUF3455 domain-containing protein n=1 Tax=Kineosporia rhizophila TaxID=84633 RepID=UPI001E453251|nr:DUF3455 domain-containing protein [Kineosporia rhizophila]MCE0537826.1 DUF3455 domain-containing protein [Kineosporia rhizophila]